MLPNDGQFAGLAASSGMFPSFHMFIHYLETGPVACHQSLAVGNLGLLGKLSSGGNVLTFSRAIVSKLKINVSIRVIYNSSAIRPVLMEPRPH